MRSLIDFVKSFLKKDEEKSGIGKQDVLSNLIKGQAIQSHGQLKLV